MAGDVWVVAETTADGSLARITTEVATAGRSLAAVAGVGVTGVVVAADPGPAAAELATYLPRVVAVADPEAATRPLSGVVAERVAGLAAAGAPGPILLGATPDGRDSAGILSVRLDRGVLANATGLGWIDGGPSVEMSVFGGSLETTSAFTGPAGIVTVRPNVVSAVALDAPGSVERTAAEVPLRLRPVAVRRRVAAVGARASIEEARVVVAGGRGVGGSEGFAVLEQLAEELGGAVGATRAAVDSGWIDYAVQIGQTGKTVKPQLYLALGISGAIQHKVGMQTAETIVAINRDPDAPLAEFADLYVVGDLFEVGPALLAELRRRKA
jgi:electron transfer flavoprotein alpha subunit